MPRVDANVPLLIDVQTGNTVTVTNTGNVTIYYQAEAGGTTVSATVNDGSIAAGASHSFTAPAYVIAAAGGADVDIARSGVPKFDAIGIGAAAPASGTYVTGNADSTLGALTFVKATGTSGHAMTVYYSPTSGSTQAALNVVSNNPQFSAMELTGTETAHGSLKIAHVGYSDASDANASAISIDLKTSSGTGTAAQGIFITSTTDAAPAGSAINVRYNSLDWFKVMGGNSAAGHGVVGIGVAIGHSPGGMLEIAQKDTSTPGIYMQAIASGTDMIRFRDSGSTTRFKVDNAGAVTIAATTAPSTPASGAALYIDGSGNLVAKMASGTVRTIAAA